MNKLLNTLLRASISASLNDREAFTDKVAQIIEQKTGNDPEAAAKISSNLAAAMESINENLLIDQLLNNPSDSDFESKIDKLTEAINRLNDNLEKP